MPHRPNRTEQTVAQLRLVPSRCTASLVSPYSTTQAASRNSDQAVGCLKGGPHFCGGVRFLPGLSTAVWRFPHRPNHARRTAAQLWLLSRNPDGQIRSRRAPPLRAHSKLASESLHLPETRWSPGAPIFTGPAENRRPPDNPGPRAIPESRASMCDRVSIFPRLNRSITLRMETDTPEFAS